MKKLLLGLSLLLIITGCGKDEVKEVEEEKVEEAAVLSAGDYYNVAIETIDSSAEGSISGSHTMGALQGGATIYDYTGTISSSNISLSGTEANIEEKEFTLEDNMKTPGEQLKSTTQGIIGVYDLDVNTCSTNERVLTCTYSEITEEPIEGEYMTPSNTATNGKSYTYTFSFNDKNELEKIDIKYANVFELVSYDNNQSQLLSEVIEEFFDNPELQFFADKSIGGGMEFGTETIEY